MKNESGLVIRWAGNKMPIVFSPMAFRLNLNKTTFFSGVGGFSINQTRETPNDLVRFAILLNSCTDIWVHRR
jgi:hypothetical protein